MKCGEGNDINVADCRVVAMLITLFPIMRSKYFIQSRKSILESSLLSIVRYK